MAEKEAAARIKINKLLEAAGWRFFADASGPANIRLESNTTLKTQDIDALGEDFEKVQKGFIDFLLLNEKGFPFIVLEAKAEGKSPLVGKEQARKYARSQSCRFVILSNGNAKSGLGVRCRYVAFKEAQTQDIIGKHAGVGLV